MASLRPGMQVIKPTKLQVAAEILRGIWSGLGPLRLPLILVGFVLYVVWVIVGGFLKGFMAGEIGRM